MQKQTQSGFSDPENNDPFERDETGPNLSPAGLYGPVLSSPAPKDPPEERGIIDRATDEISSWFGDEAANLRLEDDALNDAGGPMAAADEQVRLAVREALDTAPALNASGIDVAVRNGAVTLAGAVLTEPEVNRAEETARSTTGVVHVQNDLLVRQAGSAPIVTRTLP